MILPPPSLSSFFFFNDTATTEIYTLSLHDALPICLKAAVRRLDLAADQPITQLQFNHFGNHLVRQNFNWRDRKSTRLNSSHGYISYAVFCLKKKKKNSLHTILLTPRPPDRIALSHR